MNGVTMRSGESMKITETWTMSHQGVVLAGSRSAITQIAATLGVDNTEIVEASPVLSVLALWGDELDAYRQFTRDSATSVRQQNHFALQLD